MAKAKKSGSSSSRKPVASPLAASEPSGSEQAAALFTPDALALSAASVQPLRQSAMLLYVNTSQGVQAVLEHQAVLKRELPMLDLKEVSALPQLALGLIFAAGQAESRPAPEISTTRASMRRASELRGDILAAAMSLSRSKLLPSAEVERIRRGSGALDQAQDCVDLAALFNAHASAIKGKHPITSAQLKEIAEVGNALLRSLRPKGAKPPPTAPSLVAARDLRDRLASLLALRYERVRRAGFWLFGEDEVDARVPKLLSAQHGAKKKPAAPKPAPAP